MKIDKNYPKLHYDGTIFYKDEDTGEELDVVKYKIYDDITSDEDIEINLDGKVKFIGKIESKGNIISDSDLTSLGGISAKGDVILKNNNKYTDWKISTSLGKDIKVKGNIIVDGNISCGGDIFCVGNIKSKNDIYSYGDINSKGTIEVEKNIIVDGNISCNHLHFGDKAYMNGIFQGESFWSTKEGDLREKVDKNKLVKDLSSDSEFEEIKRLKCKFGQYENYILNEEDEKEENEEEDYDIGM